MLFPLELGSKTPRIPLYHLCVYKRVKLLKTVEKSKTCPSTGAISGSCGLRGYKYDNKAFIFSLYTPTGYNITKLKQTYPQRAIYTCSTKGPAFGSGHDLYIRDGGRDSYTYVSSYDAPPGCTSGYCPFFTGKTKFNASDVEVFYEK